MATKLDRLLESLAPERTLDAVAARADAVVNSFPVPSTPFERWEDFQACVQQFFLHVEWNILGLGPGFDSGGYDHWGRITRVLGEEYGPHGDKTAFAMARSGAEGGLYAVLKTVARRVMEQYAANGISARVGAYLERLTVDELYAAPGEYLSKYGHLLPKDLTEAGAARVFANFRKVLEQHPHLLQRLRRVGR